MSDKDNHIDRMAEGMVLLGIIDLAEAKRLKGLLAEKGVVLRLVNNPETCTSCGPGGGRVEVHALEKDAPAFRRLVESERARLLEGLPGHPVASADHEVDFDKDTADCPACGARFATTCTECPECGLGFGVPAGHETE